MNAINAGKWANGLKIASKVVGGVGVGLAMPGLALSGNRNSWDVFFNKWIIYSLY
jgi:hypothetical protein